MKKSFMKRALTLGLAVAMTVSMCACGGKDGDGEGGGGILGGGSKKENKNANAALAKEHVYRGDDLTIAGQKVGKDGCYTVGTGQSADAYYTFFYNYSYDDVTYESNDQVQMYIIPKDGSGAKAVDIETPETGSSYDEETQTYDYVGYSNYVVDGKGNIFGIKNKNHETYTDGGYVTNNEYFLCAWDGEGKLLEENLIEGLVSNQDSWMYINQMLVGNDGNIRMFVNGSENKILTVDAQGQLVSDKPLSDDVAEVFNNVERTFNIGDDKVMVLGHSIEDWQKSFLVEFDVTTGKLGEKRDLPGNVLSQWDYTAMTMEQDTLYFTNNSGIYKYKIGDAEPSIILDYVNSDLFISEMPFFAPFGENSFLVMYREDWESGMKTKMLNYVKPEDIVDKTVLLMATDSGFDYDLKKRVIEFNRNSNTHRIVTKDYSIYNSYEDWTQAQTKLNNDIIAGNVPDILCSYSYSNLPVDSYISKGMFVDMKPLLEKDEELSKIEFLQNVFDAASVNGKMYRLIPSFQINTMVAKKSLVGGMSSWTMADAKSVLNKMAPDAVLFDTMIQPDFLRRAMNYGGRQYIDVETGKCNFNTQDFVDVLEYAKTLPEEYNYDYGEDYDWTTEETKFRDDRALLMDLYMSDFRNLSYQIYGRVGEDCEFVGFPGSGVKGYLSYDSSFLISSKCSDVDGAWSFVRYYLTDDYQKTVWSLPVNKQYFLQKADEAKERPYWVDENGNKEYYDNIYWLGGEEVVLDPLTQAQVDEIVNFVYSINTPMYSNDSVLNIISEEAGAFFSGQKPAKDVADVIQRRVQMYVDENN